MTLRTCRTWPMTIAKGCIGTGTTVWSPVSTRTTQASEAGDGALTLLRTRRTSVVEHFDRSTHAIFGRAECA